LSLAVQLAFCVFNCFSFILFLSKLNDDDDDDDDDDGLLHLVQRGGAGAGCDPINGQCTNFTLFWTLKG